ncbi:ABC transporter permease [Rhodoferax lacus]|uniref:ABC transporter permease n=1 Tax=Rhodoferax lacus TaxID=2184758 RepID=A0A3E1R657_9BURK|nr:ABC transporter permease [Rhodoferax lacus]RFO94661.1 ABC transporter permease [Rhodoferax lacus]
MRWRRVKAMAVKESLQIVRDPRSLIIALLIPLLQMFLLGYGISLDVKQIPMCALDQERSQASQNLLQHFSASPYFSLRHQAVNIAELSANLDSGGCSIAIVIPVGFSRSLVAAGKGVVQALLDATDTNTASIAAGYATAVVASYSGDVQLATAQRSGSVIRTLTPVEVRSRIWFNEDLISRNFIIPGIVALVMAIVGAQLSSLTIAREWERGTMEQLTSTPIEPLELMLGKLLPYFVVGLVDAGICLALAVFWFQVPFRGTLPALLLSTSLFLTVVLCIGYFVSSCIHSQVGASQVALLLTMLPTTLLSGFSFPIDQMPAAVQSITYLVSGRYYVSILKGLFLKGASWSELLEPMLCLALYAAIMARLASSAYRKTLD